MGGASSCTFHESDEFTLENAKVRVEYRGKCKPIDLVVLKSNTRLHIAMKCVLDDEITKKQQSYYIL